MLDYIIVGQGLAGSVLAMELMERGKSVKVIDNSHHLSSSNIAGGLVHPMSFKRTILSWNAALLSDYSITYYQEKENALNCTFFEPLTFLRLFGSIEEQNTWFAKQSIAPFDQVLFDFKDDLSSYNVKNNKGLGRVNWSYRLHVSVFLEAIKKELKAKEAIIEEQFDYNSLMIMDEGVEYKEIKANGVIFCEGHQSIHNPYLQYLPENLTKGEILRIKAQNLPPYALSKNCFVLPLGKSEYILGATYDWGSKDYLKTIEAKEELLEKFSNISDEKVEVLEQRVGIRPTTIDRKPILGTHPAIPVIHVFNGLGSKGVQLAPYYAKRMSEFLLDDRTLEKEINITRFTKKYYKD
ncbi:MAG: FAD-binding oxidoreductase [Flavobacteriales bacterium]|jgi:glycine/D-amino acid oxidase-like deaminating enzyme|nr:FAD-binding oxidoreductase [Flavobacteriales bacterium]